MILVAIKDLRVVSYEQNGKIDLEVEHDQVVQVPDNARFGIGWSYSKPIKDFEGALYFFPPKPFDIELEAPVTYAVDENGNSYIVPEETA